MDHATERFRFDDRTQEILEHLTIPFAVYQYIDKRVVTIALSRGFCDEFGFEKLEDAYHVMDGDMYRATHPDDKTRVADAAYRFAAFDEPYDVIYRTRTLKDPDYIILHAYGKSIYPEPGVRLCLTWYAFEGHYSPEQGTYESVLNQTLHRILTEQSQYRGSYYDYMTGLPNIAYFYELADAGRKAMREKNTECAILFFDLTGLTQFNRRYGFDEGDRLIRAVASILAKHFSSESCARIAQDHFAAFAPLEGLEQRLDAVIEDCANANDGKTLPIRIGVYPDRIETVEIGLASDRAKLAAARDGRKSSFYAFFDMEMMDEEKNRQAIVDNLDRAIEEGWLQVYYQPIVRSTNGKVCNLEALARWNDPVRGLLLPSSFIPVLEEAVLIPKLDLAVVKQVLRDLRANEAVGNRNVPVSINFSRADFEACDLVREICALTDAARVDRRLINIEITESLVGSDFDYMAEQIRRFRAQGFHVWMDDFGSGYSSLDVLQSLKFDLIKFDMGFMRRLDEGEAGKIILTEMMKMATSLGLDTVCEGVETAEQVRFLREIGCAKLQGYYFMKPVPPSLICESYTGAGRDGFEVPEATAYYDNMGRVNLYDLSFLANTDDSLTKNTFDTVPMGIMEVNSAGDKVRYIRSNQTFRDFMKRAFGMTLSDPEQEYPVLKDDHGNDIMKAIAQCRKNKNRTFVDEKLPDGTTVRSFLRWIDRNPVNGRDAFAIAVLSITPPDENLTYADIARALAADYYNIFVINPDTNDYIEYTSQVGNEEMSLDRHAGDFFASARRDALTRIYEEDREQFITLFTQENVLHDLDTQGVFTTTYRLIDDGTPTYANMKITRMPGGNRLVLGVSIIDARMKQLEEEKKLRQETTSLGRIAALGPDYIVLYTIDPVTNRYTQYNASNEYAKYGLATQGEDFFADVLRDSPKAIAPEDLERHLRTVTKENILAEIQKNGSLIYNYRMLMNGAPMPVSMRATLIQENDGEKIILGITNDEEEYRRKLEKAYKQASSTAAIYTHIAHALARGYTDLYYVDMRTDDYIEYHTDDAYGVLNEIRRDTGFFEECKKEVKLFVHPDDERAFLEAMDRDHLSEMLSKQKVFEHIYRRILDGRAFYVQMKITRMEDDPNILVIAVSDVDELIRKRSAEERMQEERQVYARLQAVTGNFIVVYVVDPETDHYREFSATKDYVQAIGTEKQGTDFFASVRRDAAVYNYPGDLERFLTAFSKKKILAEVGRSGIFSLSYRVMMGGKAINVQMKAAMVEEKEGKRLIIGLNNIDAQVRQAQELERQLAKAQNQANCDALTGVKNKHAFTVAEALHDRRIAKRKQPPFAVVMLDINDLKKVNDTKGHQAGDHYLRDAARIICDAFKRSPVYRIGGDEFAVISHGSDYKNIERLVGKIHAHNEEARRDGGIVIACGMARFENDDCFAAVFKRADRSMYENKKALKP